MSGFVDKFKDMFAQGKDNFSFVIASVVIVAVILIVAIVAEKIINKGKKKDVSKAQYVAICGLMSALATILMMIEIPLFFAPTFYKLDFSEIPVMIGTFTLGPVAGVIIELVKVLLKLVFKGTTTAFVGDLANFIIGCSMVVPASIIYYRKKTKKNAILGMCVGTGIMSVFGSLFNGIYLLPKFSQIYGLPLDTIIAMGTEVNGHINSVTTLVIFAVLPFNILKGIIVTVITMLLYKRISPLLKSFGHK